MKKFDYKKYILKVVVAVLCIFFVGGVAIGARSILKMEGALVPYESAPALSARPETPEDIVRYLDEAIDKAVAEKPAMSSSERCSLDTDTLTAAPSTPALMAAARYISGDIERHVEGSFSAESADYGEGFGGVVRSLDIAAEDIVSAACVDEYYYCTVCGESYDEDADECPDCGNANGLELRHRDEYTVTVALADGSPSVAGNYKLRTPEQAEALADESCNGFFTCSVEDISYSNAVITAVINRLTDKIARIEFRKDAAVSARLDFEGDYEFLGTVEAGLTMEDTIRYEFSWPGVRLSHNKLSMERGATEALQAKLTCSDPTAYDAKWYSSDETIATVDEDGYIYSKKLDGKTIVTAEFEFQGQTYSDSCEVFVKTSVEGIDISKRSASLKVGESVTVDAEVSPRKATVRTFKWYTSDENVASVTADGKITAVGEGEAKVYVLADDGYYKATCKVEVTR